MTEALAFFPFALPICIWVAWSDMRTMKIPNLAVIALVLVFLVVGPFVLPLSDMGWRLVQLLVVLVIGFVANMAGLVGAGDAKFAAAMAPFVPPADISFFLMLLAGVVLAAFVTHRAARATPMIRRVTAGWESWDRADFPMGLALGGGLAIYLAWAALA